jgi:hypothetical protein
LDDCKDFIKKFRMRNERVKHAKYSLTGHELKIERLTYRAEYHRMRYLVVNVEYS